MYINNVGESTFYHLLSDCNIYNGKSNNILRKNYKILIFIFLLIEDFGI